MSIKLNNLVVNEEIFDSSDEEEDIPEIIPDIVDDEDTEDLAELLSELLEEVAEVYPIAKMKVKVVFRDHKKIKFVPKKTKCEFDIDDNTGYPVMVDGGEEFFYQYMEEVSDANPDFKGLKIETNVKNFKFTV